MLHFVCLLLLLPSSQSIPQRQSGWHGRIDTPGDAHTVAACGKATSVKENPWTGILFYDNQFQCGATILEDDLAITAAHCVIGIHNDRFQLHYGRVYQPDTGIADRGADLYGGLTGIKAIRIHPSYDINRKYEGYDIALLRLNKRIQFNQLVKPLQVVPTSSKYTEMLEKGSKVKVAGFGQVSGPVKGAANRHYPEQMQLIDQRIVPHQQCNLGNNTNKITPPRDVLCTRGKCGQGSGPTPTYKQICPGDSGSGVVGFFLEENKYYLLGVVSFIITPNGEDCGKSSKPAFSISARHHRDFIYEDFGLKEPDPENCRWKYWSKWGQCTKRCGGGTRTRRRSVYREAAYGGAECVGNKTEESECNTSSCEPDPMDCEWDRWSEWGECSTSCGGGARSRSRRVDKEARHGGKDCRGEWREDNDCNTSNCVPDPVDCRWRSWSEWGECSTRCGGGTRSRSRSVYLVERDGGKKCDGMKIEEDDCNTSRCVPDPVDCRWRSWSEWGECSTRCGGGTRSRSRSVYLVERDGGEKCDGGKIEEDDCNTSRCEPDPVNCRWDRWSEWGECSKRCGGGTRTRRRSVSREAAYGGKYCRGNNSEDDECNTSTCVLGPTTFVIPQTDKNCRPGQSCETKTTCSYIKEKYTSIENLDKNDDSYEEKRKDIVRQLKSAVCNKKEKAFCCPKAGGPREPSLGFRIESTTPQTIFAPRPDKNRWSSWSSCSRSCGEGGQTRTRINSLSNSAESSTRTCHLQPCPTTESSMNSICEEKTTPSTTSTTTQPPSSTVYSRIRIKSTQTFTFTKKLCRNGICKMCPTK